MRMTIVRSGLSSRKIDILMSIMLLAGYLKYDKTGLLLLYAGPTAGFSTLLVVADEKSALNWLVLIGRTFSPADEKKIE